MSKLMNDNSINIYPRRNLLTITYIKLIMKFLYQCLNNESLHLLGHSKKL